MPQLPSGTVTFLFTDIEGSTQLLKQIGPHYAEVLAEHQRIVREAVATHGGHEVDTQGDSFFIAFPRGKDALAAAVAAQRDLRTHAWPEGVQVKVRMGLHTGEPQVGEQRYVGMGVHKAARIGAAGHGGQVLLSATTRELVEDGLPPGVTIRDLGLRRLKDVERPERLSQLVIEGLPSEFDALKTIDVELARRRRRMYVGSALIGVLAAAVAIPVFALGQGGDGGGTVVEPNFVALIDPQSNSVVDTVQVGARPLGVAVGEGSVWVANLDDETLSRIDAATHDLVRTITLDATPTGVAAGSARSGWRTASWELSCAWTPRRTSRSSPSKSRSARTPAPSPSERARSGRPSGTVRSVASLLRPRSHSASREPPRPPSWSARDPSGSRTPSTTRSRG